MNPKKITLIIFAAVLGAVLWFQYSYPQMALSNFFIDRNKAVVLAQNYLQERSINVHDYKVASVFETDESASRYLQKTIGYEKLISFLKENDYDLFYWLVRFFKEGEKEEYRVVVSSATGKIISYKHTIEETASRKTVTKEDALVRAIDFLKTNFNFNPDEYTIKGSLSNVFDNRTDYAFSWTKNSVNIPWSTQPNDGTGKLVASVTISGEEILSFWKGNFTIPEPFDRALDRYRNVSRNISTVLYFFYLFLMAVCIYYLIAQRHHLAMHATKRFYISFAIAMFVFHFISNLNDFQAVLFNYRTTSPFQDYVWRYWMNSIRETALFSVSLVIVALAGELFHYESFRKKKEGAFLYYIQTTFLSRHVSGLLIIAYLTCIIMLGLQAIITHFGQLYLGVWTEHSWFESVSTAYIPFISAFFIAFSSSTFEEIFYRLFCTSYLKRYLHGTIVAVILTSLLWGFAHTSYPVYPMWFRGVEVTCMGLFLSYIYFQFGIVTVMAAHFLFNAFWQSAGFILGKSDPAYFYGAVFLLSLPFLWAVTAFLLNRKTEERELKWTLSPNQHFNAGILQLYLEAHPEIIDQKSKTQLKKEIVSKGWDMAVVEKAIEKVFGPIEEEK
jgi:hypothetical protein